MVFSSIVFLFYFLAFVLGIYHFVPRKYKNIVLLVSSFIFYAWGEPVYVLLMIFSAFFNYESGLWLERTKYRKLCLALNIAVNIGMLVYFKYTNLILTTFGFPAADIALPIGISFYTFQALSYTIDVYRGKTKVQKSLMLFALYLSLFPQLIAGPIVRYSDISSQLRIRRHTSKQFMDGVCRFCAGLCKKVIIANSIGKLWAEVSAMDSSELTMAWAWLGALAFAIQIYFDFSGYSDMAIGLGRIFGFEFPENFRYPYMSKSITEFWRRWHISLSSWFKEYVYIPLGGNRVRVARQYINILIVWLLTGLWHGASWNFVLWGLYYAILLIIEKLFILKHIKSMGKLAHIYAMFFVLLGWVIFAVEDTGGIVSYIGSMFNMGNTGFADREFLFTLMSDAILIIIALVIATGIPKLVYSRLLTGKWTLIKYAASVIGFAVCVAYLTDDTFNPFLYFRF